jgi:Icc-related predicted phosphoesterase
MTCYFVSDLHGRFARYEKLYRLIETEKPHAVFFGGDLLPSGLQSIHSNSPIQGDFIETFLFKPFSRLKEIMAGQFPGIFLILGNDDSKADEALLEKGQQNGLWQYISQRTVEFEGFQITGYPYVPPTPFMLKDFEKYDVSQYVDPGCIPIEEGIFTTEVNKSLLKRDTIKKDLDELAGILEPDRAILLFHSPPYETLLDRADLDGKFFEHVPLDVHIGSIAIRRFIEKHQPRITLHGHVHESSRITGAWADKIGKTHLFSAACDSEELSLIVFDPQEPEKAERRLI